MKYIRFESAKAPLSRANEKMTLEQLSSKPLKDTKTALKVNFKKGTPAFLKTIDRPKAKLLMVILWAFGPITLFGVGSLLLTLFFGDKAYSGLPFWLFLLILIIIFAIPNYWLWGVIKIGHPRDKFDQYGRHRQLVSLHRIIFFGEIIASLVVVYFAAAWLSYDYRHYRQINIFSDKIQNYALKNKDPNQPDLFQLPLSFSTYGVQLPKDYKYFVFSNTSYVLCTNFKHDHKDTKTKAQPLDDYFVQSLSDEGVQVQGAQYLKIGDTHYKKGSNCFLGTTDK